MMDYAQRDDRMVRTTPRKAPRRTRTGLRIKGFAAIFLIVVAFKVALMVAIGPIAYEARLATLGDTLIDRIGVWIMQPDPLTQIVALTIRGIIG